MTEQFVRCYITFTLKTHVHKMKHVVHVYNSSMVHKTCSTYV